MKKKKIGITIIGDSIIRYKKNNVIYNWPNELKKKFQKNMVLNFILRLSQ